MRLMAKEKDTVGWIGIEDFKQEGNFVYHSTQKAILFQQWGRNEPNNHRNGEQCVSLHLCDNGQWNDYNCNKKLKFVCEK